MLSRLLTSQAATNRLSPWLARLRQRSPMALLGFTSGATCGGRSSLMLIPTVSSWAPSVSCWQALCPGSARSGWHPQGQRHRRALQPDASWTHLRAPGDATTLWWTVHRVGEAVALCCRSSEWRSDPANWQKAVWCHQGQNADTKALLCSPWTPSWPQRAEKPLRGRRSLPLPARWTGGWSPVGHCTARAWCASSRHVFTPFAFFVFFRHPQWLSSSLGAGQHTLRLLALRARLSTFPEPYCWLSCTEGGPEGSRMCHRGFGSGICPCTYPRYRSQGEGCQCQCRGAAALSVLRFELVLIEFVHQVLGEIQNAHAHIYRAIEYQVALVDLDSCQIIVEDIGPSKCWACDEATEFVLLMRTYQLHINPLPQVFHGLPKTEVFANLYRSFSKSLAAFFRSSVFIQMYGSIKGLWSNRRARWTLVRPMPRDVYTCRCP